MKYLWQQLNRLKNPRRISLPSESSPLPDGIVQNILNLTDNFTLREATLVSHQFHAIGSEILSQRFEAYKFYQSYKQLQQQTAYFKRKMPNAYQGLRNSPENIWQENVSYTFFMLNSMTPVFCTVLILVILGCMPYFSWKQMGAGVCMLLPYMIIGEGLSPWKEYRRISEIRAFKDFIRALREQKPFILDDCHVPNVDHAVLTEQGVSQLLEAMNRRVDHIIEILDRYSGGVCEAMRLNSTGMRMGFWAAQKRKLGDDQSISDLQMAQQAVEAFMGVRP